MNRVLKFLMASDVLIFTGFGLVEPILAIFFKENVVGGSILTAGIAGTIFLLVKSAIQLPFSKYVDHHPYEARLRFLIYGAFFISCVPFVYLFAQHIYVIFLAQVLYGIGTGLAYPAWLGLWSTNLDEGAESFEWSLYSTLTSFGVAVTAAVGAAIAQYVSFNLTFVLAGVVSFCGCFILVGLFKRTGDKKMSMSYHRKRQSVKKLSNI